MKKTVIKIAIVFLGILAILTYFSGTIEYQSFPLVTVGTVRSGSLQQNIYAPATIEFGRKCPMYGSVEIPVIEVLVQEGMQIEPGTPLARVAPEYCASVKAQYESDMLSIVNEQESLYYQRRKAKDTLTRMELDHQIEEAQLQETRIQSEYDSFVNQVNEQCLLLSGAGGVVTEILMKPNETIVPYAAYIMYTDAVEVKEAVFECDDNKDLKQGQTAKILYAKKEGDTLVTEKLEYEGRVTGIEPMENGRIAVSCEADGMELETGTDVSVEIELSGRVYETIVPNSAITSEGEEQIIYILKQNEKGQYIVGSETTSVIDKNNYASAVDLKLNSTSKVVTSASRSLQDGQRVRLE